MMMMKIYCIRSAAAHASTSRSTRKRQGSVFDRDRDGIGRRHAAPGHQEGDAEGIEVYEMGTDVWGESLTPHGPGRKQIWSIL